MAAKERRGEERRGENKKGDKRKGAAAVALFHLVYAVHEDAPATDDVPVGHFLHDNDAAVLEYVPAEHFMHNDPAVEE